MCTGWYIEYVESKACLFLFKKLYIDLYTSYYARIRTLPADGHGEKSKRTQAFSPKFYFVDPDATGIRQTDSVEDYRTNFKFKVYVGRFSMGGF